MAGDSSSVPTWITILWYVSTLPLLLYYLVALQQHFFALSCKRRHAISSSGSTLPILCGQETLYKLQKLKGGTWLGWKSSERWSD